MNSVKATVTDPIEIIWQGCYLCLRLMLVTTTQITGCLRVSEGCYVLKPDARAYHPLEAVLVGEDAPTGDWRADAIARLGVEPAWFDGFLDGFAEAGEQSRNGEYIQGYVAAEELRQCRPSLQGAISPKSMT